MKFIMRKLIRKIFDIFFLSIDILKESTFKFEKFFFNILRIRQHTTIRN